MAEINDNRPSPEFVALAARLGCACGGDGFIVNRQDGGYRENCFCTSTREAAVKAYPDHHPATALANYRAGREVWDTNGDAW